MNRASSGIAFMPEILKRLAPRLDATVLFEPEYKIAGCIQFSNGKKSYFWHNKFNLNSVSSARIAQDKGYSAYFLRENGLPIPDYGVFLEDSYRRKIGSNEGISESRRFAANHQWNVFLKPLRKSGGTGIYKISSEEEFENIIDQAMLKEKKVLLQQAWIGKDYRVVVLDGKVISAYERIPLSVKGDGSLTIGELLLRKQNEFVESGRDTIIPVSDPRLSIVIKRQGFDLHSIPPVDCSVLIFDVANLSCGGSTRVVDCLNPVISKIAIDAAFAMDLRLAGVDIVAPEEASVTNCAVIEINSAPGLDHYAQSGEEHDAMIDDLYFKLLTAIERG